METGTDRAGAFCKIRIRIQTIITSFVHFVYYDIELTKINR